MKRHYLVGYDISDEKRLAKVAKIVSGYGTRVQYSFFHCYLSVAQKKSLQDRLKKVIKEDEDQVLFLPVTEKQLNEMEVLGFKVDLQVEGIIIV
jgi:CRISPR-associated protein Cas2